MKLSLFMVMAASWLSLSGPKSGHEVQIDGDRISVRARQTPLYKIMEDFVQAGVRVKTDADLNTLVTGSVNNMPMDEAMNKLLASYGYVLIWEVVPGPLGNIDRLEEIQVFRRDGPRQLEPFMPDENFRIARGPLPDSPEFVVDEILISVKPGTNTDQFKALLAQVGGSVIGSVPELGIYRIRLPAGSNVMALVDLLKNNAIVSRVEPNYAYKLPAQQSAAEVDVDQAAARASRAAAGVPPVAVLDSGLRTLASLEGLVVSSYNAIDPERSPADRAGHGTQMALIASGAIPPGGTAGSDQGVPVVAIRAFDDNGYTSNFTMMRAIQHAAGQGAKVINLSWGTDSPSSFLESAMMQAQARGLVVVASAGNVPTGKPVYPAAYPGVISVSATQADGQPWSRSNFGTTVTLAAPGTANFPVGHEGPPGGYAGTSISSAYVARQIALYLARHPKATANQVKNALLNYASPLPSGASRYGQGTLDAAAVSRLLAP